MIANRRGTVSVISLVFAASLVARTAWADPFISSSLSNAVTYCICICCLAFGALVLDLFTLNYVRMPGGRFAEFCLMVPLACYGVLSVLAVAAGRSNELFNPIYDPAPHGGIERYTKMLFVYLPHFFVLASGLFTLFAPLLKWHLGRRRNTGPK